MPLLTLQASKDRGRWGGLMVRWGSCFLMLWLGLGALTLQGQDYLEGFSSRLLGREVGLAIHAPSREALETYRASHPGARLRMVLFLPGLFDGPKDLLHEGVYRDLSRREGAGELAPSLWVAVTHFKSWYVDRKDGRFPYERFLVEELIPALEQRFPGFGGSRESRSVAGLSMGGLGALNLSARSRLFERCLALSPALVEPPFDTVPWYIRSSLKRALPSEDAAFRPWSPRYHKGGDGPLRLTAGTEDRYGIEKGVQAFAETARQPGRSVEVFLSPGGHNWKYWSREIARQAEWIADPAAPG